MTTSSDFQRALLRLCEGLQEGGASDDKVEAFKQEWLQKIKLDELKVRTEALAVVEACIRFGQGQPADKAGEALTLLDHIKQIAESPETRAALTAEATFRSEGPVRYPNIQVDLDDLGDKPGPIIRRVSYAMRDAGVDEDDIERYAAETRESGNPVKASRQWVQVT